MKRFLVFAVLAAFVLAVAACGSSDDESSGSGASGGSGGSGGSDLPDTITIGVPLDLSGSSGAAPAGMSQLAGMELAAEEINDTDFLGGTELVIEQVDTVGDTQAAVEGVLELINAEVDAVVGFTLTQSFLAAGPQLQEAGIPTMTTGSAAPGVTEVGDYIFRLFPDASVAFPEGDLEVAEAIEAETAAYLTQSDVATTAGLAPVRQAALEEAGIETVAEQNFASTDTDLRAQLTEIKEADPDILVATITAGPQTSLFLQAAEVGLDAQIIGSSGVTPEILEQAGEDMQCAVYPTQWVPDSNEGSNQRFVELWEEKDEGDPDVFTAFGYGGMWSMAEAIKEAGSDDGEAIRDALASIEEIDTPFGTVNYTEDRDAHLSVTMLEVVDSEERVWDPSVPCEA